SLYSQNKNAMLNTLNKKSQDGKSRLVTSGKTKLFFAFLFSVCILLRTVSSAQVIAAGSAHSLAVCSDNTARSWGSNNAGQLGDNTTTDRWNPIQVSGLTDINSVAGQWSHSIFLKNDSTVWGCGDNIYGDIGDGTVMARLTPVQVNSLAGITEVAAGHEFS